MTDKELGPGSEGDAYRYTKKVLLSLPNRAELERIYEEIASNRGISSWTRAAYMELRRQFFRDGQCKIKFAPGAARIAFGELLFGTGDEDFRQLADLRDYIRIISIAHFEEYTRHIAIGGNQLSFQELTERYGGTAADNWKELKKELRKISYGPRRYRIIWLDQFETGKPYYKYTQPHGWCHLNSKSMFDSYSFSRRTAKDGTTAVAMVKLYLAVLPGFETMTEDDPLYGESMLGIDIGPDGRLMHVNNRWNHAHDSIDERKGDNKYSERELSELLGAPFYRLCTPYTKRDYARYEARLRRKREKSNGICTGWARLITGKIVRALSRKPGTGRVRTLNLAGTRYRTLTEAGTTWMLDPVSDIPATRCDMMLRAELAADRQHVHDMWKQHDRQLREEEKHLADIKTTVVNTVYVTETDGDPVPYTEEDEAEDFSVSFPRYQNLASFRTTDGKIRAFRSEDVAVLSRVTDDGRLDTSNYDSSCSLYRKWRSENIPDSSAVTVPDDVSGTYAEDGAMSVMVDDWSALEIYSPLGFSRSAPPSYTVNGQPVVVDDVSTPGKNFVSYRASEICTAVPEGWRLPTVDEFVSMAMRHGSRAEFGSGIEWVHRKGDKDYRVTASPAEEKSTMSECLFEGFVDGNMERRHEIAEDPAEGRGPRVEVDFDDMDEGAIPTEEEFGLNIDRVLPRLGMRFPSVEFHSLAGAGFTFPDRDSLPGTGCGKVRIPLVIPQGRYGDSREFRGGFRDMPMSRSYVMNWTIDDDNETIDSETCGKEDGTLYAVAELDRESGKIQVSAGGSLGELRGYFMVYCVRDKKK